MTPHPPCRTRAIALIALACSLGAGLAEADDQAPPPPYPSGSGPAPAPQPYPPPYSPPPGAPPGYGPPVYAAQPPGAVVYGPAEITEFDDSAPTPYGYTRVQRTRKGLIIGGAVTLGATYLATAFIGAVASDLLKAEGSNTSVAPVFLPVAGPFLEIAQTDSAIARFYLTVSGLGQTAGAIMLLYGISSSRTVLVRNDQLIVTSIAPMIAPGAAGLSVVGRF
ncbi:MAG TPA: hypothetical protein VHT91_02235 [Kofleriaceae bacterium]|jgi:hypothetical protein|nr:hypothetical protein [Kofleriaceae bacterium]